MEKTKKTKELKKPKKTEAKSKKVEPKTKAKAEVKVKTVTKTKKPSAKSQVVSHGVGRRKRAVARVWLRRGKGGIKVNGKDFKEYFDIDVNRQEAHMTFNVMKVVNYDADVNVYGGGVNSQAEAVKLGIARALVDHNADLKADMRKWRLLTVDSRVKERKKYGQRGARRKFQFVKR